MNMRDRHPSNFLFEASSSRWAPGHLRRQVTLLRQSGLSCHDIAGEILAKLGTGTVPLDGALLAIAAEADRSGTRNAFHNPDHARDVGVVWLNLALACNRLAAAGKAPCTLSDRELALGVGAAFGHDIGHDGTSNYVAAPGPDGVERSVRIPFRLETVAADRVCDILLSHGADPSDIAAARAMILSTDVEDGHRAVAAAVAGGTDEPPGAGFAAFAVPAVRLMAAILRDADVIPSAGLSPRDYDRQTKLFEAERRIPGAGLGPTGAEDFLGGVLGGRFISPPGKLFQARLDALRALNGLRLCEAEERDLDLESAARLFVSPI